MSRQSEDQPTGPTVEQLDDIKIRRRVGGAVLDQRVIAERIRQGEQAVLAATNAATAARDTLIAAQVDAAIASALAQAQAVQAAASSATTTSTTTATTTTTTTTAPTATTTLSSAASTSASTSPTAAISAEQTELHNKAKEAKDKKIQGQVRRRIPAVQQGAKMRCSRGTGTTDFRTLRYLTDDDEQGTPIAARPAPATVSEDQSIQAFGQCLSPQHPEALRRGGGLVTIPVRCTPSLLGWTPAQDAKRKIGDEPMLDEQSTCLCAYGGEISFLRT